MPIDFSTPQERRFLGEIPGAIPLAILTALRDLDMPDDRDELGLSHQSLNLRRRLGLSRVVLNQIRRYEAEREDVTADEVVSLFRLVARRTDAAAIFEAAGHGIARVSMRNQGFGRGIAARLLPLRLRRWRAWKWSGRIARRLCPDSPVRVAKGSRALEIEGGLPAHATDCGHGCALLVGLIDEVLEQYRATGPRIVHSRCEARGEDLCVWAYDETGTIAS